MSVGAETVQAAPVQLVGRRRRRAAVGGVRPRGTATGARSAACRASYSYTVSSSTELIVDDYGRGVDRRQLEYFLAVVEHGGITRASTHLHITQPTISTSLRKLEAELGGLLFERAGAGLVLTAAGRALLEPAGQVLRDFDVAAQSVRGALGLRDGRLDLCAVPAVGAGWLPAVIAAFRRDHPRVAVSVVSELDDVRIADEVRSGRYHLGLAVSAVEDAGLVSARVGEQELQAIFPPGAPGPGTPVTVEELLELDLITVQRNRSTSRRWFEAEVRRRGLRMPPLIEMGSIDGVLPLVTEGIGYALWWTPMSPSMLGGCVVRPVRPGLRRDIHLLRRSGPLPPATRAFMQAAGIEEATP